MGKVLFMRKGEVHTAPSNLPAIGTALNDMTWEEVRAISDAGLAASYFSVGDTKSLTINGTVGATTFSNLTVDCFIIGIDHNSAVEGTNKIHFQIGKDIALCDSYYNTSSSDVTGAFTMNPSNSNSGGWASSHMRSTVLGSDSTPTSPTANTLLAALPTDLLAVMKPITKYSDNTGGGSDKASYVTATTDYLPLLAEFEVFGVRTNANSAEQNYQEHYDYYAAGNSAIKYQHDATDTAVAWWTRSVSALSSRYTTVVSTSGSRTVSNSNMGKAVSPLFCV